VRNLLNAPRSFHRNIPILTLCWVFATLVTMTMVSVSALTGHMLVENKAYAAMPIMLQWLGTAGATIPASYFMQHYGRRAGFMVGAGLIAVGAAIAVLAVYERSFVLFCLGTPLVGAGVGFNWYYRFAAAEVSTEEFKSRGISLVLAGGIVGALVAPALAIWSKDWLLPELFAGTFATVAVFGVLMFFTVAWVDIPRPAREDLAGGRPFAAIARQPAYVVAVIGGVVSYSVMILMMSVSPLALRGHGYSFGEAAIVIQLHMLGMYLPSFFTGQLVRRYGAIRIMQAGAALNAISILFAVTDSTLPHFWVAMALLGIGWNFLFIASTTLLTETYSLAERAKAQGINDFLIFSVTGAATLFAGSVLHHIGWAAVAWTALPAVLLTFAASLWLGTARRRATA
jgi:MFS family permease